MFHPKKTLVATLLTLTLLVAPAALASPDGHATPTTSTQSLWTPSSWMLWIQDLFADLFGEPSLEVEAETSTDDGDDGEASPVVQPNG